MEYVKTFQKHLFWWNYSGLYSVHLEKKMYFAPIVFVFDLFAWIDEKGFDIVILMYHIKYATWLNAFPFTDYNCLKPFPK